MDEHAARIYDHVRSIIGPYFPTEENILHWLMPKNNLVSAGEALYALTQVYVGSPRPGDSKWLTEEYLPGVQNPLFDARITLLHAIDRQFPRSPRHYDAQFSNLEAIGFRISALPAPQRAKESLLKNIDRLLSGRKPWKTAEADGTALPLPHFFIEQGTVYSTLCLRRIADAFTAVTYPERGFSDKTPEEFLLSIVGQAEMIPGASSAFPNTIDAHVSALFAQYGKPPGSGYINTPIIEPIPDQDFVFGTDGSFHVHRESSVSLGLYHTAIPHFFERYGITQDSMRSRGGHIKRHLYDGVRFYLSQNGLEIPFGNRRYTDQYEPRHADRFTPEFFTDSLRKLARDLGGTHRPEK
ncbi:MAG TPA: hypothetical protein VJC16_00565 [Candidatus Nanoarchaeia archaeon]|nr:hypothetical protein [Candidatus Nanoarchaeia archaeon]